MILCFELTMPSCSSWNGRWSGARERHLLFMAKTGKADVTRMKELDGKSFFYRWDDGWCACVEAKAVTSREATKLKKLNAGFCGYNWMAESIFRYGKIMPEKEWPDRQEEGEKI